MVYHEILTSSQHIRTSASECVYGVELVKIEWYTIPGGVLLLLLHMYCRLFCDSLPHTFGIALHQCEIEEK